MHSSKGLEFEYVWIAHMDERSLGGGKKMAFSLPEAISEKIEERDIDAIKRKLYVAITRAKRFCTLSYALASHKGREQELAKIISDLPPEVFQKDKAKVSKKPVAKNTDLSDLIKLTKDKYGERNVSASLLNNFFECPWKWYFNNLLQLPTAKTESLEFGIAVHSAVDKILKLNEIILPEDKEVAKVVSSWAQRRLQEIAPSRESEQSVSLKDKRFSHLNIYGKIDLIENLDAQSVRVTDFKTGSVRKKSDIEKIDEEGRMSGNLRQLAMYSYLIQQSPKWKVEVSQSRLEFLEAKDVKEAFYDRIITEEDINLLVQDIKDYDSLVKKGEWINRPCNYNSYGKNTECEYCKMAEIYTIL
ncbi:MAG: PD-(D/E)XK nuclease family protein [Patescibacteria group bacterium]